MTKTWLLELKLKKNLLSCQISPRIQLLKIFQHCFLLPYPPTISLVSGKCLLWASKSWRRFTGLFGNFVRIGANVGMSPEIASLGFNIFKSFINWLMGNSFWSSSANATGKFLHLWRISGCAAGGLFVNADSVMIFAALIPRYIYFNSTWEDFLYEFLYD